MSDKTINFAARCEYLSAIEVHWPDVMKSLRLGAFPVYRACLETTSATLQTLAGLSDALKRGASVEINQVELALRAWARVHGFRDTWLRDVAVQSMHSWARGGTKSKWTYLPEDLDAPKFEPDLGYWIPFFTKWPTGGGADRRPCDAINSVKGGQRRVRGGFGADKAVIVGNGGQY